MVKIATTRGKKINTYAQLNGTVDDDVLWLMAVLFSDEIYISTYKRINDKKTWNYVDAGILERGKKTSIKHQHSQDHKSVVMCTYKYHIAIVHVEEKRKNTTFHSDEQ